MVGVFYALLCCVSVHWSCTVARLNLFGNINKGIEDCQPTLPGCMTVNLAGCTTRKKNKNNLK